MRMKYAPAALASVALLLTACGAPQAPAGPSSLTASRALNAQAIDVTKRQDLDPVTLTPTTVRADFLTTYADKDGCSIAWGDGVTETVSPPTLNAKKYLGSAQHTYASSGTFTLSLTCGTQTTTKTFLATAPVQTATVIDFESDPACPAPSTSGAMGLTFPSRPFLSGGLVFTGNPAFSNLCLRNYGFNDPLDHNWYAVDNADSSTGLLTEIRAENGLPFDLISLYGAKWQSSVVNMTGYAADGSVKCTGEIANHFSGGWQTITFTGCTGITRAVFSTTPNTFQSVFMDEIRVNLTPTPAL